MKTTAERVSDVLSTMNAEQVKNVYGLLFDMWCWDSDNEHLKEIVDAIQKYIDGDNISLNQSQESSITHSSNGIRSELFKFNWGSLSLGADLEFAIQNLIANQLLNNSSASSMLSTELNNIINNAILFSPNGVSQQADIDALRFEIDALRDKIDELKLERS